MTNATDAAGGSDRERGGYYPNVPGVAQGAQVPGGPSGAAATPNTEQAQAGAPADADKAKNAQFYPGYGPAAPYPATYGAEAGAQPFSYPGQGPQGQQTYPGTEPYPGGPQGYPPPTTGPGGQPAPAFGDYQPPATVMGIPLSQHVTALPVWGQADHTRHSRFSFCAWMCFAFGFFMPVFWIVAAFLPLCLPGRSVRTAAIASFVASLTYLILAIVLAPTMATRQHRNLMSDGHMY